MSEWRPLPPEWDELIREVADYFLDPVAVTLTFRAEIEREFASEHRPPGIHAVRKAC